MKWGWVSTMKSRSQELLDRAISAMVAGIEIYNKPGFPYRNESFTILAINGWELLLKAKWLTISGNKITSLYVYERNKKKDGHSGKKWVVKKTRSGSPFTHSIEYLGHQLMNENKLDTAAWNNIEALLEYRDTATHFYNSSPAFGIRLYEVGAACVKNFATAVYSWFNRGLSEFDLHLMPLSFVDIQSTVSASLLNANERNFLSFVQSIDSPEDDPMSPYSVAVNVDVKFVKSKAQEALPTRLDRDDPQAVPIVLTEEDWRERYPWDYAELTESCAKRYEDFKCNSDYHLIRKTLEAGERFAKTRFLDPKNPKSNKKIFFNTNILQEFDKHYTKR